MDARRTLVTTWLAASALALLGDTCTVALAESPEDTIEEVEATPRAARSHPVRALWITRWDYRTEQDVRQAIRWTAAYGFDRVFFQVRGRADAFYRSSLEPWGEELGGDPGFDPLAVAVEQARMSRIELHAWMNLLPGWKGAKPPRDRNHVVHQHPEWFLVDLQGRRLLLEEGEYTVLNPCLPEVRSYLARIVRDVARRYAVDGIHLDYVRFVQRDPARGRDFPYDPTTMALFRRHAGVSALDAPAQWDDWRRRAVNTLVYDVTRGIRAERPQATISVAAIADYERARNGLFQDVVSWQRFGWVDEICPMTYKRELDAYRELVKTVLAEGDRERIYPAVGAYLLPSAEELRQQVEICRALQVNGFCVFAYSNFFPSRSHESSRTPQAQALRAQFRDTLRVLFHDDEVASTAPSR